jgi:hypothetical protein
VGIETDIMGIQGAESMCAGYNAAMRDSDAKYKVYMHQDVFILNVNFIEDIIRNFRDNPDYGILGMAGSVDFAKDGNYLYSWHTGMYRSGHILDEDITDYDVEKLTQVKAVDGVLIATQYDLPWREDIFDGFDFYDISQCMEFHKAGYKIGVPHQGFAWCLHDSGVSNMSRYDGYRKIFCNEYGGLGYEYGEVELYTAIVEQDEMFRKNVGLIERLIEMGDAETAHEILKKFSSICVVNSRQALYAVICKIMYWEKREAAHDFYNDETNKIADLVAKFTRYKYFLRRVELGFPLEGDEVYQEISARTDKRLTDLCELAPHVTIEPQATIQRLAAKLGR